MNARHRRRALLQRRCQACRLELDRTALAALRSAPADEVVYCEECGSDPGADPASRALIPSPRAARPGTGRAVGARPPHAPVLLRHGQTALSIQRRYSGHGDPELTAVGMAQAAGAAAAPRRGPRRVTAVLTSPLRRARQTAAAVAQATGVPLVVRDGLIETDFGEWEGLTFAEARDRDPELHAKWLGDEDIAPPGGESFAAVGDGSPPNWRRSSPSYQGETLVVVSTSPRSR